MRFKIAYDLPNLTLGGQVWPVVNQVIDIPEDLEPELRLVFPLAEEITTTAENRPPATPATDPHNKA